MASDGPEGPATGDLGDALGPRYAIVGRVRKAHGLRGELVVEPVTSDPAVVFAVGRRLWLGDTKGDLAPAADSYEIRHAAPFKGGWIVRLEGLTDRNVAELWRERYLFAPFTELRPPAEDEVYEHELLGMQVELASGDVVGQVAALYELPQGLTLEVRRNGRAPALVPYRPAIIQQVDVARRTVVLDPPEGLLD